MSDNVHSSMRVGVNLMYLRPGQVGGSETYIRELITELREQPDLSIYLLLGRESIDAFHEGPTVTKVLVSDAPYSAGARLFAENWSLREPTRIHALDVLFSPANFGAPLLPERVPQVVTVHDFQHDEYPDYFSRRTRLARSLLFKATFARATHIVAISDFTRRAAIERYHVAPDRISTIHQGARINDGPPPDTARDIALDYGLCEPFFIYPAMVAPHKNHRILLRAFQRYVRSGGEAHLVLTGKETDHDDEIRSMVAELDLEARLHPLGFIPRNHVIALMSRARALLFPSRFEGFGLPPLEAMSLGVPVAAARAASIPEVVGDSALQLEPDDEAEWARAMRLLAGDSSHRDELVARGRERVRAFTWQRCASATQRVLREAAACRRSAPCS